MFLSRDSNCIVLIYVNVSYYGRVVIGAYENYFFFKIEQLQPFYIPFGIQLTFIRMIPSRIKKDLWSFNTRNLILICNLDFEIFFNVWLYPKITVKSNAIYFWTQLKLSTVRGESIWRKIR